MGGGPGGSQRPDEHAVSGVSRRRFLAGGLLAIGGASQLIEGATRAQFSNSESASGSVGVATINRDIVDESSGSDNVRYELGFQVIIDSGFDSIDITVENLTDNVQWTYNRTSTEGLVVHDQSGGGNWGWNDQYQITYDVYVDSSPSPVLTETVTDVADGSDPSGNDDLSNPDSPELDWVIVDDSSTNSNGVVYDVYYEVTNLSNFGEVEVTFQDNDGSWATRSVTNTNAPIGSVNHTTGNYNDSFDIIVDVKNDNGLTVDSTTISDTADGTDPATYGDPTLSDSPTLDSFTVTDNTSGQTSFDVDYTVSNTTRFAGVDVIFDNMSGNDYSDETIDDPAPPDDPITYDGYWTSGDTYHITVEVFETREGVTFPITAGTVEDVAGGSDSPTTYPQDSI